MAADIGFVLSTWQQLGVFEFILPFMLIFAISFGILTRAKIFGEQKAVNSIIAFALAGLAISFSQVRLFFGSISGNLAMGIVVLLAVLILIGLFVDINDTSNTGWRNGLAAFGVVVALIVILVALSNNGMVIGYGWWNLYWPHIIVAIVVVGSIIAVIATSKPGSSSAPAGH